jgi:ABC-type lipoprotein export system ATPase subunit
MVIEFENVMPDPLSGMNHGEKSIWGNSFTIEPGNKVMLNASSGKGKTTFTHLLSGIRKDYKGKLSFDNQLISEFSSDRWTQIRKEDLAIVFQDLQLFPDLTVEENLILKNDLNNLFTIDEIKSLLAEVDVQDKWNKKCRILSMGQQQRVAIVRALLQPYKWLLMDEPFSHLDEENTQKCLTLITQRTNDLKAGFILTTLGDDHGVKYDQNLLL